MMRHEGSGSTRPNPWMARLLVLALLYQVGFFPFSFAAQAGGGAAGRIPLCTGSGIVWVDAGNLGTGESPGKQGATKQAGYGMCPLCAPAAATPPEGPVLAVSVHQARQAFAPPQHAIPRLRTAGPGSARAPPRAA